jgi:hypothetical protein
MTAAGSVPDPALYVSTVILLYLELPETQLSANLQDHAQARRLHDRGISLALVESAFLLASLRRLARPTEAPPLPPIRSLAYFLPVIEELLAQPMPENYLNYLRLKLRSLAAQKPLSADVQKNTFLDDR